MLTVVIVQNRVYSHSRIDCVLMIVLFAIQTIANLQNINCISQCEVLHHGVLKGSC